MSLTDEQSQFYRQTLEMTKKGIEEGLKSPLALNLPLYESQQARRILDRLVGYKISPLLWEKVRRGISAGRVQSVALRLVTDREKEILQGLAQGLANKLIEHGKHLKAGDVISVRERSRTLISIQAALEAVDGRGIPEWLELEKTAFKGVVRSLPSKDQISLPVNEQMVVELYSR